MGHSHYRIPDILKHCCIAIYREGGVASRSQKDRFKQSLTIARSRLAQYGFIVLAGESIDAPVGLTPKGRSAEQRHKREGRSKSVLFDTLYDKFDIDGHKAEEKKKAEAEAKKLKEVIEGKAKTSSPKAAVKTTEKTTKAPTKTKTPPAKKLPKGKKIQ